MEMALTKEAKAITISKPEDISKILHDLLNAADPLDQDKEHVWAIFFNNRNRIIRIDLIGVGTLNTSLVHPRELFRLVHPRELFRPGIGVAAASVMMAHNHPSGDATPSEADFTVHKRLKEAGEIIGIALLDSIIVDGKGGYYSFREKGI